MSKGMSVKQQLTLGFGGLATACAVVAGWSVYALGESDRRFEQYVHGIHERSETVAQLGDAMKDRALAARNLLLADSAQGRDLQVNEAQKAHQHVQELLSKYQTLVRSATDMSERARTAASEIENVEKLYGPVALSIVQMAAKGQTAEATAKLNAECVPLLVRMEKVLTEYVEISKAGADASLAASAGDYRFQRNSLLALAAAALMAAAALGTLITRRLLNALGAEPDALNSAASRVADGDLSPIAGAAQAPQGSVMASMARMQGSLVQLIGRVRTSADSIATASSQIATGNQDLSGRTEQQASALEQTSAQMHQMTDTVRNSAASARQATQLANEASAVASQGGEMVGRVVQTMNEISDSSRKIADIIGVIDGIAFQTNILALNAAVEAARAGEQGRGFAVVAGEVRNLASRSAEAAREIKSLIGTSVDRVEAGSRLVTEAGSTMNDIVQQVRKVSDLIAEIDMATGEQSTGIEQVNQAVSSLDQGTQQNAALVEQSAAAAESLRQQASEMTRLVATFKLDTVH